jgi:gliding motility-associated-like protein
MDYFWIMKACNTMVKRYSAILVLITLFIQIHILKAADYYWIGGNGDWSEISHWATSSGGVVTYSQTPTANDNVIFDQNSFTGPGQIVTINSGIAFCNNITFTNLSFNPTFRGNGGVILNVYGSFLLSGSMTWNFSGDIVFASADIGNSVNFINHPAAGSVRFDGTGSWTIQSTLKVVDRLEIVRGTVNFGAALVTAAFFISDNTNNRTVNFQSASINLTGTSNIINPFWYGDPNNIYTIKINAVNWVSTADNGLIDLDAQITHIFMTGTAVVNLPAVTISNNSGRTVWINESLNSSIIINGNLEIRHDANIQTGLSAEEFRLSPGKLYELLGGATFNFTALSASGDCANLINLLANPVGMAARVNFSEAFSAEYLILRDIHANGVSSTALNSINLGNNMGWTIVDKAIDTFYWTGRNGIWNNPSNWSLSSGGPAAGCIPTLADNVVFDNNSFTATGQFAQIYNDIAYCRDMIWTNIVMGSGLSGNEDDRIFINGNLNFTPSMTNNFLGEIFMVGSGNLEINTSGIEIRNHLYLNNPAGSWRLENDLYVQKALFFVSGGFNTNSYSIDLNRFISENSTVRNLQLNSSAIYIRDRNFRSGELYFWSDNLALDAGTSHIIFGNGGSGVFNLFGAQSLRFFDLSFLNHQGNLYASSTVFPPMTYYFNNVMFEGEGYISGLIDLELLSLNGGNEYIIDHGTKIRLRNLATNSNCNGLVSINTSYYVSRVERPEIEFMALELIVGVSLKNINATGVTPVLAFQSIDRGGNSGFSFMMGRTPRTLYWVGNSGSWFDTQHWSLTSGGAGGECIPTELDDVIIDNNSFNITNGFIDGGSINLPTIFCKNFLYDKSGMNTFYMSFRQMNIHGDYRLNYPISNNISFLVFSGETQDQEIFCQDTDLNYLYIKTGTKVTTRTDVNALALAVFDGVFDSDGNDMDLRTNCILGNGIDEIKPEIFFRDSKLNIHGRSFSFNESLLIHNSAIVHADSSYIQLDNLVSGVEIRSSQTSFGIIEGVRNDQFNVLTYAEIPIRKLILTGNGNFQSQIFNTQGLLNADTLILTSGKSYVFQSTRVHRVNKFLKARGNNCNPISIRASVTDQKAIIQMPASASIDADFVQMRDIRGVGGAVFNAGPYSTNVALSNENWIFPGIGSIDETVGFLGEDRFLCPGQASVLLDANNFTIDEVYMWSTGNTGPDIMVSSPGEYSVTVTFGNNCVVVDTIRIVNADNPGTLLPADTTLCNSSQFIITPLVRPAGSIIEWSDGSQADQLTVSQSGEFTVNMTAQGCSFTDSIRVVFVQTSAFTLGSDRFACDGDIVILTVDYPGGNFLWNTGSTQNSINVNTAGVYSIRVDDGPCILRDTVSITFSQVPVFSLGRDTSICEGASINLSTALQGVSVSWQDGSTSSNFIATAAGTYMATASQNGCLYSDTISVSITPLPVFYLGNDTTLCEGQLLMLRVDVADVNISWFDGTSGNETFVSESGTYNAVVVKDGCTYEDEIDVQFITIAKPDLGRDTVICEGQSISLNVEDSGVQILWNTGSTQNTISVASAGDYFVFIGKDNCTKSDTITVSIAPLPSIVINENLNICTGDSVTVNPIGVFDSLVWIDSNDPPVRVFSSQGIYEFRAVLGNCAEITVVRILELPQPIVELGDDFEACQQDAPRLNATGTGFEVISWNDSINQPVIDLLDSGLYSVQVFNKEGCSAKDSVFVTILDCGDEIMIFPNIFKPNSTLGNGFFGPALNQNFMVTEFEMRIFDRFGNLVYMTKEIDQPWNGKYRGTEAATGVYVYVCTMDAVGPRDIRRAVYKGSVTLVE